MSFFNFIDTVGPPVPAAFMNAMDNIRNVFTADQSGFVTITGAPTATLGNPQFSAGTRAAPLPGGESAFFDLFMSAPTGVVCFTCHNVSQSPLASTTFTIAGNDQAPTGPTVGPTVYFIGALTSSTFNSQVFTNVPAQPLVFMQSVPYAFALGLGGLTSGSLASMLLSGTPASGLMQFQVAGAGVGTGTIGTNALIDMTPDFGTVSVNISGCTTSVPLTLGFERIGRKVRLWAPATATGTSNATTMSLDGLPSYLQPANNQGSIVFPLEDNGTVNLLGSAFIVGSQIFLGRLTAATGTISASGFTAAGIKGVTAGWQFTYSL